MFAMIAVGLGLSACSDEDAHDPLEGVYEAPTDLVVTGATVADKTKDGSLRTFTIQFSTDKGVTLNMVMVSNQYYLTGTGYTYATSGAKNGNYITGSTINGSQVVDGTLNIAKNGDDYSFSLSALQCADGKWYRINSGTVTLAFDPDDPTYLTEVLSASANADGTVTVLLSTGGYETGFDMTTYQTTYTGEGNDWQIVFKTTDGKLHEGTYAPGTGYVSGYEFENDAYAAWGIVYTDYAGTLWYTIADGARTPSLITTGDIKVSKVGSAYKIEINQGKEGVYAEFNGKLPEVDPDYQAAQELTYGGGANWVAWGGNTIALGFAGPGASIEYANWSWAAKGTGCAFNVEFFSTDGTLAPGTYVAAEDDALAAGTYKASASVVHQLSGDVDSPSASSATFKVSKNGDTYTIETTIDGVDYEYNGPISL